MAFSAATLASAATIDILIPPSIPLILFALTSNASIAALFSPASCPACCCAAASWRVLVGRQAAQPAARDRRRSTAPAFRRNLLYAAPAVVLPVLIIVFLRFGIATPTEVAVLSTLYAGAVSALLYRDLSLKRLQRRDRRGRAWPPASCCS